MAERLEKSGGSMNSIDAMSSHFDILTFSSPLIKNAESISGVIRANARPLGIYVLSPISSDTLGLYAHLSDTSVPGMSEFVLYRVIVEASNQGYRYINLGGAESESLYSYKKKFGSDTITWNYAALCGSPRGGT